MWQSDRGAIDKWALFVSSLQKISEQLSFPLHEDGPSPHEAEAVLLQDVVAVLHYLRETHRVQKYVSLLLYSWGNKGNTIQSCKFKTSTGRQMPIWIYRHLSAESLHHILTIFLHLCIKTCSSSCTQSSQHRYVGYLEHFNQTIPLFCPVDIIMIHLSLCHQSQSRVPPAAGH